MPNKPAPVTDAVLAELLAELLAAASKGCNVTTASIPDGGCPSCDAVSRLRALAPDLAQELIRLREVLRLWDDHLPGCSGSPRCECGYAEARALLGEVQDGG